VKPKWVCAVIAGLAGLAAFAANVLATPATTPGFSGTTQAQATYGQIDSHVVAEPGWQEKIKTHGASDLYVQQNTWDPSLCGGCTPSTGWHTHPGPSFIIVTQGSVAVYDGDDPTCARHVYTANTADNAFVDPGGGHVHVIRNETGSVAKTIAVQLIPAGAGRRQDSADPGNCPF
jgi:hypothetical protein